MLSNVEEYPASIERPSLIAFIIGGSLGLAIAIALFLWIASAVK